MTAGVTAWLDLFKWFVLCWGQKQIVTNDQFYQFHVAISIRKQKYVKYFKNGKLPSMKNKILYFSLCFENQTCLQHVIQIFIKTIFSVYELIMKDNSTLYLLSSFSHKSFSCSWIYEFNILIRCKCQHLLEDSKPMKIEIFFVCV